MNKYALICGRILLISLCVVGITLVVVKYRKASDTNARWDKMQILVSQSGIRFDRVSKEVASLVCITNDSNLVTLERLQTLNSQTVRETGFSPRWHLVRVREGYVELKQGKYELLGSDFSPLDGYRLAQNGTQEPVFWNLSL